PARYFAPFDAWVASARARGAPPAWLVARLDAATVVTDGPSVVVHLARLDSACGGVSVTSPPPRARGATAGSHGPWLGGTLSFDPEDRGIVLTRRRIGRVPASTERPRRQRCWKRPCVAHADGRSTPFSRAVSRTMVAPCAGSWWS